MSILKDLTELVKDEIISEVTAGKIQDYYRKKGGQPSNRVFIVFGILGAILVGLGIILIVAHNWDDLSRLTKTFFAFFPLLTGQVICGYILLKKQNNIVWSESSAAFLFFAVGACLSLVSQIYNIPGNLSSFLLTWMLLCLPIVYVMKSSIASLLYIAGITFYGCESNYFSYPFSESYFYWLLLLMGMPHYYQLYKNKSESNFMIFHNWFIPLSLMITLGTIVKSTEELIYVAYFSLFGLFYLIGNIKFFRQQRPANNGYEPIGSMGTILLLLFLSFDWFWQDIREREFLLSEVITSPEFIASFIFSTIAGWLFYRQFKNNLFSLTRPIALVFILFIITFIIGLVSTISVVLINFIVFMIGIITIRNGARQDHLGVLNFGLLIITALVICRYFDSDLSFVIRGILFLTVGVGFFAANYLMLKNRKSNE